MKNNIVPFYILSDEQKRLNDFCHLEDLYVLQEEAVLELESEFEELFSSLTEDEKGGWYRSIKLSQMEMFRLMAEIYFHDLDWKYRLPRRYYSAE